MHLNYTQYAALHDASNGLDVPIEMVIRLRDKGLVRRATGDETRTFSPMLAPHIEGDPHCLTAPGWQAVEEG